MDNELKWDGSMIDNCEIISRKRRGRYSYWKVKINNKIYWCYHRQLNDLRPVIADELKPLFGLNKIGTLVLKRGKIYHLLTDIGECEDITLTEFMKENEINITMKQQTRRIFAFRLIMNMNMNTTNSLVVRADNNNNFKIYSLYDSFSLNDERYHSLPNVIEEKWFDNVDVISVVYALFKRRHILERIEKVVIKIDPSLIYISSDIEEFYHTSQFYYENPEEY